MPNMYVPDDPKEWQNAMVARAASRSWRQFLILDCVCLIFFATICTLVYLFVPSLKIYAVILTATFICVYTFILLGMAPGFLIKLFSPSSEKSEIANRVWNRLWGLHQFLSKEYILITEPALDPPDHWSKWLGGPAYLVLYDGFAAYIEYGNRFSRVVGAGAPLPFLDKRETIKAIVDLRPQFREFSVSGWTKDGIKVIMEVRMETRIGADYSPGQADPKRLYPFDARSVIKAVEYTAVKERGGVLVESDWCDGAVGKITGLLGHHISTCKFDELHLINKGNVQILSPEALKNLLVEANRDLKNAGIHVSSLQITETRLPENVYGQRLDVWKAGKDGQIARIHGEGNAFEIKVGQEAYSRAQRDLILAITRSLESIPPTMLKDVNLLALSKVLDKGLNEPLVKALMSQETLALLENYCKYC
jgi:hypothetical protein